MRILYLTDRLSRRGGADNHLIQVIEWAAEQGHHVAVAFGRLEDPPELPIEVEKHRLRGLASAVDTGSGLGSLDRLLDRFDLVHVQNVMNPTALRVAAATGRLVATIQDHRVFCPAVGKTLPDGARCDRPMSPTECEQCLDDDAYRARTLCLTEARRDALRGARCVVLSRYMAAELAAVGLAGAEVVPPWVETAPARRSPGDGFLLGGRLVAHKGVLDAVTAWREADVGLPLRVAGAGPLLDQLDGVEQRGWLTRRELRRELSRARALLFPSRWQEPFGILGVEALAAGTPVIVMQSGGTDEWSGAGCLRVATGDLAAMAAAVSHLASDAELAVELGRLGREMVAERFSRVGIEPNLRALYRS